jgi:hypothetical protein
VETSAILERDSSDVQLSVHYSFTKVFRILLALCSSVSPLSPDYYRRSDGGSLWMVARNHLRGFCFGIFHHQLGKHAEGRRKNNQSGQWQGRFGKRIGHWNAPSLIDLQY